MDAFSKLLTAIAALISAVAWPAAILALLVVFRSELKQILVRVPNLLDRVRKATLAGINLELNQVAAEVGKTENESGKITPRQIEAAARIKAQSRDVDTRSLLDELDRLCLEYDSLRRSLPSGPERTRAMTQVLVRMRSLAPSVIDSIDAYKGSGSAGSRLAAIAITWRISATRSKRNGICATLRSRSTSSTASGENRIIRFCEALDAAAHLPNPSLQPRSSLLRAERRCLSV